MKIEWRSSGTADTDTFTFDRKLASYLAASASIGAVMASDAKAIVISNPTVQNIGINGFANIDFNSDGQTDFQIDHDRVNLTPQGGPIVDYLQVDKNDVNGASPGENLFATDFTQAFPANGTPLDNTVTSSYLVQNVPSKSSVEYPTALLAGAEIGPFESFDFQEGSDVYGPSTPPKTGRFNRLIDEDHGQADVLLGGKTANQIFTPNNSPQFVGVQNQTRYLGLKMGLNSTGQTNYGWVGIKITNEADATGQVVGYGYETDADAAILAGTTGARAGDYNNDGKVDAMDYVLWRKGGTLQNETVTQGTTTAEDYTPWRINFGGTTTSGSGVTSAAVPEPGSLLLSIACAVGVVCSFIFRRIRGK